MYFRDCKTLSVFERKIPLITHKPHSISPREASSGNEEEERVGPIIYSDKYLFNKSKFYLEKFLIL
jgi:hypothetical protein